MFNWPDGDDSRVSSLGRPRPTLGGGAVSGMRTLASYSVHELPRAVDACTTYARFFNVLRIDSIAHRRFGIMWVVRGGKQVTRLPGTTWYDALTTPLRYESPHHVCKCMHELDTMFSIPAERLFTSAERAALNIATLSLMSDVSDD